MDGDGRLVSIWEDRSPVRPVKHQHTGPIVIFDSMWRRTLFLALVLAAPAAAQQGSDADSRRRERERLVDEHIRAAGIRGPGDPRGDSHGAAP